MRIVYLTLAAFILLGIGATCRTPPIEVRSCASPPCDPAYEQPGD